MNYLSLMSDSSLELIAKYTLDIRIFPILHYCSINYAEQILFRNIYARAFKKGFYIELKSSKLLIYYKITDYFVNCFYLKIFRDDRIITAMVYGVCNGCENKKINLWEYGSGKNFCANIIGVGCKCKK